LPGTAEFAAGGTFLLGLLRIPKNNCSNAVEREILT